MNILPHKSWHVRTKKNIARVRKDEAEAAEKEKEIQRRVQLAAQEARTSYLRERAGQRVEAVGEDLPIPLAEVAELTQGDGHINFFQDLEAGMKLNSEVNKEHEEEKKKEQEDYEKKIGYLVYLGQDSLEQKKDRPWYERQSVARTSASIVKGTSEATTTDPAQLKMTKFKEFEDPLKDIRKFLSAPGMKKTTEITKKRKIEPSQPMSTSPPKKEKKSHKSHKSKKKKSKKEKKRSRRISRSDSDSGESETDSEDEKKKRLVEKLRAERLEREREERRKAEKLLATLRGDVIEEPPSHPAERPAPHAMKQKYNSQFNPQLARQNYDD